MQVNTIKQPMGKLAGGCILLAVVITYIINPLIYGNIPFVYFFKNFFDSSDAIFYFANLMWILMIPALIFAGISAIMGNTKLIAISLFVYAGLDLLDNFISLTYYHGGANTLLVMVLPISLLLAGITLLTDNSTLKLISAITAVLSVITYIIRRIINMRDAINYDYFEGAKDVTSMIIMIFAQLLLAAAVVFIVFAGEKSALAGAVHAPYMAAQPMAAQAAAVRCPSCGATIAAGSAFCGSCGSKVEPAEAYSAQTAAEQQGMANTAQPAMNAAQAAPNYPYRQASPMDAPSTGYAVLCFFFPVVGLILYLVWKDEFPMRAKSAGKGAIIGVIANVVLTIIYVLIAVAAATMY